MYKKKKEKVTPLKGYSSRQFSKHLLFILTTNEESY